MRIEFEWDPRKADANRAKHGVTFEEAMSVFLDPLALSVTDDDRSLDEERWVTLGRSSGARLLLVVHTQVDRRRYHVDPSDLGQTANPSRSATLRRREWNDGTGI